MTAYPNYAVSAFQVRASGYLLKPVTRKALEADVAHALSGRHKPLEGRVVVRTSAGLRVLLSAQKAMNKKGGMVIRNVSEAIMEIFDMVGFTNLLNIEE